MRLFVAFGLPPRERREIHESCAVLRERDLPVRWVPPDRYHVTLKFLGEVDDERVEALAGALHGAARETEPFEVELSGVGAFPTIRRPRVLWLGVDASPRLRSLKQDVEWAMAGEGFEREARTFHPHLTLGRALPDGGAGAFRGLDEVAAEMDVSCAVRLDGIELMRSVLSSEGPRYSVVSSIPLGEAG